MTRLDDMAVAATGSVAVAGRRAGIAVASSGLLVSMLGAAPASAASASGTSNLPSVDTAALTASARAVLDTGPVVRVAANTKWTFDVPKVTVVKEVKRVVTRAPSTQTSRSNDRSGTSANNKTSNNANVPAAVAGNEVLEMAARYVGTPYKYGGTSPNGFDCSGFTQYVFGKLGISLPRSSSAQHYAGTIVSRENAKPGDLIWSPGHIAIYAGGNTQIDSPRPGKSIQFRSIWQSNPVFIRVTG